MIVGVGVDIVEIDRIKRSIAEHGDRFLERVFTQRERDDAGDGPRRDEHLAARFAAKEAALKAIGTGWSKGVAWTDAEIRREASGKPTLHFSGRALEIATDLGADTFHVSLSHTESTAIAYAVLESGAPAGQ